MVSYEFHGDTGEFLDMINIPQRHHYKVKGADDNTVGVFQDNDTYRQLLKYRAILGEKRNPVTREFSSTVVGPTIDPNSTAGYRDVRFDNYHQTNNQKVEEPTALGPGCPECFHDHWRWGALVPHAASWGNASPLIPGSSRQSIDIGVVRFPGKVGPQQQWTSLVQGNPLRQAYYYTCPRCTKPTLGETGIDPVFWFSPISGRYKDSLFYHTAWFNPRPPNAPTGAVDIERAAGASEGTTSQDGPFSVLFGDVYQTGTPTFAQYDLSSLPPLPGGYSALGNTGYSVTTTAIVSGPHVINFSAASVADENAFNNLRIFHLAVDPFDPDNSIWVDATIDSPNTPPRDLSQRTLSAKSMDLGIFTIGTLVQSIHPSTDVADIVVTSNASSNPITARNQLTYTLQVTNNGPQVAHKVAIRDGLSIDVHFESAASAHGSCKELDGTVFCSLNSLNVGETATISMIVTPTEGTGSFAAEGKNIYNGVLAKAEEADNNIENNSATETTLVLPNPNKAPTISITNPHTGARLVGPTSIAVSMMATDSDGTISKVEVFDNGELIGEAAPAGNNQYLINEQNASFGNHSLIAVATDNGGRENISNAAVVIVNGVANVSITSPSTGALLAPTSNVVVIASASHPSGTINQVEFFANDESIGFGTLVGGSQYNLPWNNLNDGIYALVAVVSDGSGVTTTSPPITVTVASPPTVTITNPTNGSVFPSLTNISLSSIAQSPHAPIDRVDFYANGVLVGSASDVGTVKFTATWRHLVDGVYSLTAVATDNLGVSTTSAPITIGVNATSPQPGEFVWFDDDIPAGATKHSDGDVDWYWVDANPAAFSGSRAHQSKNFGQLDPGNAFHKHYFDGATSTLPINAGDKLFTYVFLDISNMPREIMLEWKDANSWEHRAYWGGNAISLGTDGTNSRRYMGTLPQPGTWARLEVPVTDVGLQGATVNGMSFALDGGRATFDMAGKVTPDAAPRPTSPPNDTVWFDDVLPTGAVPDVTDDVWNWVQGPVYSGSAHQSYFRSNDVIKYRSHRFTGAQTPMQVNPGDVLFAYVYLGDPDLTHSNPFTPDQIMLEWYDGASWNHRAYWGLNYIGQQIANKGVQGTEGQRYMGGLPSVGRSGGCGIDGHPGWCRLEVPASYVGLEGRSVSGMAFNAFRDGKNPFVTWDRSGKSPQPTSVPLTLSATASVSRLFDSTYGYSFETNEQGSPQHSTQKRDVFFVHPNQAAGTVPMYRFRKPTNFEYFYSRCRDCNPDWQFEGIAFYVYPDSSTTGTVPLYLYHDSHSHYFLTTDQNEGIGLSLTLDGISAYVYPITPNVPLPPYLMPSGGACASLNWISTSTGVTGFKIERRFDDEPSWTQVATLPSNVGSYFYEGCASGIWPVHLRIRATNSAGESNYSNEIEYGPCPKHFVCPDGGEFAAVIPNVPPDLSITTPKDGDLVPRDFVIATNAFDVQGNGTLSKVEFFANGDKIGEVSTAPHVFPWTNAPFGNYSLTARVTDSAGATTTSAPVTVTVGKLAQSISFDSVSDKTYGDYPFSPYATASSGLPVSFSIVSGPATISENVVTITGTGIVTVRASQDGNEEYNAATAVDRSFNVAKASATITLSNLSQAYDGTTKPVAATTNPAGLTGVSITYNGSTTAPTNVGSYSVVATLTNDNYSGADATGTLTVAKASQTITLDQPANKTYGDASFALSASSSSSLPVSFSIASGPAAITGTTVTLNGAGTNTVRASQSGNENYNAAVDVDRSFTVAKGAATITLTQLQQTYDGSAKAITATTNPAALSGISISYNGSSIPPTNAGSYSVTASLANENYAATDATGTLVIAKASATITLSHLEQTYDGTAKAVTATITPTGLSTVSITYNGSSATPTNAGSYSVIASLANDNYAADATGTLLIAKATPSLSWSDPAGIVYGTTLGPTQLNATPSFNGSSLPGSFAYTPAAGTVLNPGNSQLLSVTFTPTDSANFSSVTGSVHINVNAPPNLTVSTSSIQDIPAAPAEITISADASDSDGSITKVELFIGSTLVATYVNGPYNYAWSNVAAGTYSVTAKATDNLGAVTSKSINVRVNAKPSVSLSSPSNGASYIAPALISLNASASDSDGSIGKVEFFRGTTLISTVTASPYIFNWSYVPAGAYTLTARATDDNGATTFSNAVNITVAGNTIAIGKIAFTSNRDGCEQIYLMNTDGTGQSSLTSEAANSVLPKWSPDNTHIVFQSDRNFESDSDEPIYGMDIYVMNWDGSGVSHLTTAAYDDIAPVWSPDGTKIAFQSFRNGLNYQIYVMNADGGGQVNISNNNANDTQPSWSPDGTKIAFASDRDQAGFSSIYVMTANGSNQTRVTLSGTGFLDEQPAWSPDGMKLAFITTRDSTVVTWNEWLQGQLVVKTKLLINKEVYLMNADGSSPVRLTNIMGNDDQPVWSPDGTKIVFRSDRDRNCCDPVSQIWTMNADGSNQINLSNSNFGDYCPSWSR
jgi:Tol biopolymer transport system component